MHATALLIALLSVQAPLPPAKAALDQKSLLLSVAIPAIHEQRCLGPSFSVVVTNVSDKPVRVWREWCSWGHDNLSLEFHDRDGKKWIVTKQPKDWAKNYPDFAELASGESMIFTMQLTDDVWQNLPPLKALAGKPIKMRVRYHIPEDAETKEMKVWTGKLGTAVQEYTVGR